MNNTGFICLHRKIRDNFLWRKRRKFSEAEAWLDILMEAQYSREPREVMLGMKVLRCSCGQTLRSKKSWSRRWNWSEHKVRRFFKTLEKCKMIVTKNEGQTTRLTVCNYGKYNNTHQAGDEHSSNTYRETGVEAATVNKDKKGNKEKKGKNSNSSSVSSSSFKSFNQLEIDEADEAFRAASEEFLANE